MTERLILGGSWSAYFYDGLIYSSDIQQGFDVLKLKGKSFLDAKADTRSTVNPQSQVPYKENTVV